MSNPLIYHANGKYYSGDAVLDYYENLKRNVLSSTEKVEPLPKNVLLLTFSNFQQKQDLELICDHLGYPLVVLGQQDSPWVCDNKFRDANDENRWINLNKLIYLKDFIENYKIDDFDYIIVLDATDVIINGPIVEVIKRFEKFNCEALFNAEVNCFSTDDYKDPQDEISKSLNKPLRYLNSGCYVVRTSFFKTLVDSCFTRPATSTDDQIIFHRLYVENYPKIKIDHDEVIFKCLFNNYTPSETTRSLAKLAIGLPMLHPFIHYKFVNSYLAMQRPKDCKTISWVGSLTALARNAIVDIARNHGFTHLLFLDTDMTFPQDTIQRLLSHNKDIVSGLYFERYRPHRPMLRRKFEDGYTLVAPPKNGLIECDALGAGCLLVKMEVFEKISKPYFEYRLANTGIKETFFSEDIVFCERAKEAGFKIYCDTSVRCGHLIADYEISEKDWDGTQDFIPQNWG